MKVKCPTCEDVLSADSTARSVICPVCETKFDVSSAELEQLGLNAPVGAKTSYVPDYEPQSHKPMQQVSIAPAAKKITRQHVMIGFLVAISAFGLIVILTSEKSDKSTLTSELSTSGTRRISSSDYFGCTDKKKYSQILSYAVQKDVAAFSAAIAAGIADGSCTTFNAGEPVTVLEGEVFSGLTKIRRQGDTKEYWTAIEAIR